MQRLLVCVILCSFLTHACDVKTKCLPESQKCILAAGIDKTKLAECTKQTIVCTLKCQFGDALPQKDIDCAVGCATASTTCMTNAATNTTKQMECGKIGEKCTKTCFQNILPKCVQGEDQSPVAKCAATAGVADEPKTCADFNKWDSCMTSECGSDNLDIFKKMIKYDFLKQSLCGNTGGGGSTGGGGTTDGSCDPKSKCLPETQKCMLAAGMDKTKMVECTKQATVCTLKCQFGDALPQKDIDCAVGCATASTTCLTNAGTNTTKQTECHKIGEKCSQTCFQNMFPKCVQGEDQSPVAKCAATAGSAKEPKTCADFNKWDSCMTSECGSDNIDVFKKMIKYDFLKKSLCGDSTGGGDKPVGPSGNDPCQQKCATAVTACVGTDVTNKTKIAACSKEMMKCALGCQFGPDFPEDKLTCFVDCSTSTSDCYKKAADKKAQDECGNTNCTQKCMENILPPCLKGAQSSPAFKCAVAAGLNATGEPASCDDVNKIQNCMATTCKTSIPAYMERVMGFKKMAMKFCKTLSPTVTGGTMSPTVTGTSVLKPTKPPTNKPPTAKDDPNTATALSGTWQLVTVCVVLLGMQL